MKFEDTSLPKHPTIEKAFAELVRLDESDRFTSRGVKIASLIANDSATKDPDAIAAGLLVPLASDTNGVLLGLADVPVRVSEVIESVFELGRMTMRGEPIEDYYKKQDAGARSVILASSTRMFEVMKDEMETSIKASLEAGAEADAAYLQETLTPLKQFSHMICSHETEETALAKKCENAVLEIERLISGPNHPKPGAEGNCPRP